MCDHNNNQMKNKIISCILEYKKPIKYDQQKNTKQQQQQQKRLNAIKIEFKEI